MSLEYKDCLKRGKIKPFSRGKSLAAKEIETAIFDLERSKKTYKDGDYKWATIQIYYSMFHSARALLYYKNLREHSHFCLISAIKSLYVETLLSQLRHSDPEQGEGEESCIVEILRRFAPQNDKCNSISQNDFVVGIHRLIWT